MTEGNDQGYKNRLPAMYPNSEYVEMGGLMSYATDIVATLRRAATCVGTIAKGADLPAEQFVINLKSASRSA